MRIAQKFNCPGVGTVLLGTQGVFFLAAALVTLIPSLGHDRVPKQFIPVWSFLLDPFYAEEPNQSLVKFIAVASQLIIGVSEAAIGWLLMVAAFVRSRRTQLARLGLGYGIGLFGTFMLTMFIMHDKNLPAWNQYPAILAMFGVTWMIVRSESASTQTT